MPVVLIASFLLFNFLNIFRSYSELITDSNIAIDKRWKGEKKIQRTNKKFLQLSTAQFLSPTTHISLNILCPRDE